MIRDRWEVRIQDSRHVNCTLYPCTYDHSLRGIIAYEASRHCVIPSLNGPARSTPLALFACLNLAPDLQVCDSLWFKNAFLVRKRINLRTSGKANMNRIDTHPRRFHFILSILLTVTVVNPSFGADPDPLSESFTSVRLEADPGGTTVVNEQSTISGNTVISDFIDNDDTNNPDTFTYSYADLAGRAGQGSLGAKIKTNGNTIDEAQVKSTFHDIFTVVGSQPNGTLGTMQFVYNVSGQAIVQYDLQKLNDVLANPGYPSANSPLILAHMRTSIYGPDGNGGAEVIAFQPMETEVLLEVGDLPSCGSPCGISGGPYNAVYNSVQFVLNVPFTYGEPLPLSTLFWLRVQPDQRFIGTSFNPFFSNYGTWFSEEIDADFNNTAELVAIVNAADPTATISAPSGFNYSSLVTDVVPAPVPLPAAIWLLAGGLFGLARYRRYAS